MRLQVYLFLFTMAAVHLMASAQENPCSDPKAARIGVISLVGEPKPSDVESIKRIATMVHRFQSALIGQLPKVCVVSKFDIFDDPANFPALKGSTVFEISGVPSFRNPDNAALSIQISALEGPYIENKFSIGSVPVLIERGSDYDFEAKVVLMHWRSWTNIISGHPHVAPGTPSN